MWTTAEPFSVSLDPPAVVKTGVTAASVTSGRLNSATERIRGCGLALFVRLGRRIFRHHQRCGIQGDLESSTGGIHPRVVDGHADCAHDGHSDDRHQRGYTAPGVFEETGQHAAHPKFV